VAVEFNIAATITLLICTLFLFVLVGHRSVIAERSAYFIIFALFLILFFVLLFNSASLFIYNLVIAIICILGFVLGLSIHRFYIYTLASVALVLALFLNVVDKALLSEYCMVILYLFLSVGVVKDLLNEES
jgi:hypothetical protein